MGSNGDSGHVGQKLLHEFQQQKASACISVLVESKRWQEALSVLDKMETEGVIPLKLLQLSNRGIRRIR